jgi:hypothetical protein
MIARYLQPTSQRPARPEAARKLIEAYDRAVQEIATNPGNSLTHPRPYRTRTIGNHNKHLRRGGRHASSHIRHGGARRPSVGQYFTSKRKKALLFEKRSKNF